jgi:ABC-type glycerol-3-phosphate transport system substrate-binding protein
VAAVFERLQELKDKGCFQEGFMSTALWPEARYVFLRGEAAFFLGLISDVAHWKDFAEHLGAENVGVMTCPVFQAGPEADRFPVGGAFAYALTAWTKVPKEGFAYVAFVANEENARTFLTQVGSFPANQRVDRALFADPNARQIAEWLAAGRAGSPMTGKMPEPVGDALRRECQRLLSGQTDVATALADIQGVMDAELGVAVAAPPPPGVLIGAGVGVVVLVAVVVLLARRRRAA